MEKKILIIEDDADMCEEMAEILRDEGYNVAMAFEGLSGNKLLEENEFDLLLLDLKLPGMGGVDILKKLRAAKKNIKVLVLTGNVIVNGLEGGMNDVDAKAVLTLADGVVMKPFHVDEVLKKIQELV